MKTETGSEDKSKGQETLPGDTDSSEESENKVIEVRIDQEPSGSSVQVDALSEDEDIILEEPGDKEPEKKPARKKYARASLSDLKLLYAVESNVQEVLARFKAGCECSDLSCFRGLNPESVYRHRLNKAELTKEEHDMYLMGVTMACMSDPGLTGKRKERQRLRSHYVFQGRKVCLSAFLYLENCTLYQLKRIRKHVMTHGVTPRVHGNHGKKPHNVFSLDIYRRATTFLKDFIKKNTNSSAADNTKSTVIFPSDISRKTIHNKYQEYVKSIAPSEEKILGYSTFSHFMKEQFPHVRFCKADQGPSSGSHPVGSKQAPIKTISRGIGEDKVVAEEGQMVGQMAIPIIVAEKKRISSEPPFYIYSPYQQIVQQDVQPQTITVAPISNTAQTSDQNVPSDIFYLKW